MKPYRIDLSDEEMHFIDPAMIEYSKSLRKNTISGDISDLPDLEALPLLKRAFGKNTISGDISELPDLN